MSGSKGSLCGIFFLSFSIVFSSFFSFFPNIFNIDLLGDGEGEGLDEDEDEDGAEGLSEAFGEVKGIAVEYSVFPQLFFILWRSKRVTSLK